mgnify:CR=1 FL=1
MKTTFVKIAWNNVNTIINKALSPKKNKLVEDEYVGSFTYNIPNNSKLWFNKKTREKNQGALSNKPKQNDFNIVIVLESPHKDEYKTTIPHPAIGTTGNNLSKYSKISLPLLCIKISAFSGCFIIFFTHSQE